MCIRDRLCCFVKNPQLMTCNKQWPVCLYDHTHKMRAVTYLSFRSTEPLEVIDNYFDGHHSSLSKKLSHSDETLKLSLIHISEPTRPLYISYAVFCLKKKKIP
eukprot:TRINITY_DN40374_c0_g1_i1.p2 TRINITY_DN40374_c0_g1~~TRINITY_DN40374_c0_g1_i1.p2  ORF type:complete len:103 (+),score=14.26 TRINITY_DN40374_c0_g1_i1:150-458(+)